MSEQVHTITDLPTEETTRSLKILAAKVARVAVIAAVATAAVVIYKNRQDSSSEAGELTLTD